jgi:antitoxin component YwqK of YwqJK toxin-antitoxin module
MKTIITLFFLTLVELIIAQNQNEQINYTDSKGLKQGYWSKKYQNGKTQYEGNFKDNYPIGIFRRYYESGKLKAELNYIDKNKCYAKLFYENDKIAGEGNYINNKKDSIWQYYSFYSGLLIAKENYKEGQKDGISEVYFENGNISQKITWKNGKKEGPMTKYFDNGKIALESNYINDVLEGMFITYFLNGYPEYVGYFKNGKKEGKWTVYDESNKIISSINYKNGIAENEKELDEKFTKEFEENLRKAQSIVDPEKDAGF